MHKGNTNRLIGLTGQTFNRWTVLKRGPNLGQQAGWECQCECGTIKVINGDNLRTGKSKSCGCLSVDTARSLFTTHGKSKTSEFRSWVQMRRRCHNPKCPDFPKWGGRGISVCDRWRHSFEAFLADMGKKPSPKHSLERINNNGNYEPGNCKWATQHEQMRNFRRNRRLLYKGQPMILIDAIRLAGNIVRRETARNRIAAGWSVEDAVETPPMQSAKNGGKG